MSIVSYNELLTFANHAAFPRAEKPVIEGVRSPADVNASSIDVRLGATFLVERKARTAEQTSYTKVLTLSERTAITTAEFTLEPGHALFLRPGEFVLAHTAETFNLPLDISAEFRLKSSAARMGLSHALAVWCDPGWHDSTLTLELHNISRYHTVALHVGDKIGQMIFHRHAVVPSYASYAVRGAYNNDKSVSGAKPPKEA